jgi:hypothetical protein
MIRTVHTFATARNGRAPIVMAYTTWANPAWDGCITYEIEAATGAEAKRIAIARRRAHEAGKAEGIERESIPLEFRSGVRGRLETGSWTLLMEQWEHRHGKRYPFDSNPHTWVGSGKLVAL